MRPFVEDHRWQSTRLLVAARVAPSALSEEVDNTDQDDRCATGITRTA